MDAYNDKSRWAEAGIYKTPLFDISGYQRKIDRIVGLSPSGHSVVKLVWAWDARKWENTEWDAFGNAVKGEWRQKYRALSVDIGEDDYVDIAPPRWILEERYEPQAIAHSWELTRYRKVVTGQPSTLCPGCGSAGTQNFTADRKIMVGFTSWIDMDRSEPDMAVCRLCGYDQVLTSIQQDVWGPVPREGWYNLLPQVGIIADHANGCCKRSWDESREICYGTYKEPNGKELKRLKKAIRLRNKELATNPHIRPDLDPVALEQARRWGLQIMEDKKVKQRNELAELKRAHRPNLVQIYA